MDLSIRNAKVNDSLFIVELSRQLGYETNEIQIKKRLEAILANNDNCVFVAEENNVVIGWIHAFHSLQVESDFFVEIGGLVIDENHRRKGIGQLLIGKINTWAKSKECQKIRVRCNTKRKESHIFYQQIGFTETKEQKIFDKQIDC
ncbi:GNAT family N-acetyltransferase [Flavobacterium sp.]|uniref:GNAT family N-acetyltransferase n=1 Tax=Flavobacterium sp. TaxID=239 RepID=UPI003D6A4331